MWTEYEAYIRKLCSYKLQSSPQYIDDCVQDVFLELYTQLDKGVEIKYPKAWLTKVANNKINDIYKSRALEQTRILPLESAVNVTQQNVDYDEITEEEIEQKLQQIIVSLSQEEKTLFEDFFINHTKQKKIALKMGISENLVQQRVFRLKRKIVKHIQKDS